MGFGEHLVQNSVNEDPLILAQTGRPSHHQHYAIHTKPHDPWWVRWGATRDAFYQHDWDVRYFLMYALKGAVIGGLFGATQQSYSMFQNAYEANKHQLYSKNKGVWGPFSITFKNFAKYGSMGALAGIAYFGWHYSFCTARGHNNSMGMYLFSNGVYFGMLAACYHPRRFGMGALFGLLFGCASHIFQYGNIELSTDRGIVYEIPGLSEQQRQKYKQWDQISELSWNPHFREKNLKL